MEYKEIRMKLFSYEIPKKFIYFSSKLSPYHYDIENQYHDYSFLEEELIQSKIPKKIFTFFDHQGYIIDIQDLFKNIDILESFFDFMKIEKDIFYFIKPNTYHSFIPDVFSKKIYGIFHYYFSYHFQIKPKQLVESIENDIPYEWFVYYIQNYGIEKLTSLEVEKMIEYERYDLFYYSEKYQLIPEDRKNILLFTIENKKYTWLHAFIEEGWFFHHRVLEYMITQNYEYDLSILLNYYTKQCDLKPYLYYHVLPNSIHILNLLYKSGCKPTKDFIDHCCIENKILYLKWALRHQTSFTLDAFRRSIEEDHLDCFEILFNYTLPLVKNRSKLKGYLYNICIHHRNKKIGDFLWEKMKEY